MKQRFNNDEDDEISDEKIVLDKSAFKALASDTRVEILKELDVRRKTITELSENMNLAAATIKEHIEHLAKSGLVKQKDEGRKWKYYDLSEKGKAVLYPERKKIWVILVSLLFVVSLASYMSFYDVGYIGHGQIMTFNLPSDESETFVLEMDVDDTTSGASSDVSPDYPPRSRETDESVSSEESDVVVAVSEDHGTTDTATETIDAESTETESYDDVEILVREQEEGKYYPAEATTVAVPYIRYASYAVALLLTFVLVFMVGHHVSRRSSLVKSRNKK